MAVEGLGFILNGISPGGDAGKRVYWSGVTPSVRTFGAALTR